VEGITSSRFRPMAISLSGGDDDIR